MFIKKLIERKKKLPDRKRTFTAIKKCVLKEKNVTERKKLLLKKKFIERNRSEMRES